MTRIISGAARGRRLTVPAVEGLRPTTDRVREAMFSTLTSMVGTWQGRSVLDLYAGSGALGLEALSRGARSVLLVERDSRAVAAMRRNAAAVDLDGVTIRQSDVLRLVSRPADQGYDVVLADPPYRVDAAAMGLVLAALVENGWLSPGARVVIERDARSDEPVWPPGLAPEATRSYSGTTLWYGLAACAERHDDTAGHTADR